MTRDWRTKSISRRPWSADGSPVARLPDVPDRRDPRPEACPFGQRLPSRRETVRATAPDDGLTGPATRADDRLSRMVDGRRGRMQAENLIVSARSGRGRRARWRQRRAAQRRAAGGRTAQGDGRGRRDGHAGPGCRPWPMARAWGRRRSAPSGRGSARRSWARSSSPAASRPSAGPGSRPGQRVRLALAVAVNGLMNLVLFFAFGAMAVALVMAVFYLNPVLAALLSAALGRERLTPVRILALAIACAGSRSCWAASSAPTRTRPPPASPWPASPRPATRSTSW